MRLKKVQATAENVYHGEILKGRSKHCRDRRFHIIKSFSNNEASVTTLYNCLERGYKVVMLGKGTVTYTQSMILDIIKGNDCLACLQLELSGDALSNESKKLVDIDLPCTMYWTMKEYDAKCGVGTYLVKSEIELYRCLTAYRKDLTSEIFKNYFNTLDKCYQVKSDLEEKGYKRFATYPGKRHLSEDVVTAVVFADPRVEIRDTDLDDFGKETTLVIKYSAECKENLKVNDHIIKNKSQLSKEGRDKIKIVINKYAQNLMRDHTNLNAVKASCVRSKKQGRELLKQECIALYCSGKGIIPLLETPFPEELDGYKTDVREGWYSCGGARGYEKALSMGLSIGLEARQSSGSIGMFVEETDAQSKVVHTGFLTCSHVFFDLKELVARANSLQSPPLLCRVRQPSKEDDIPNVPDDAKLCGEVESFFFGNVSINNQAVGVDVAYVRISNEERIPMNARLADVDEEFTEAKGYVKFPSKIIPILTDVEDDDTEKDVYKCGRTTGFTSGTLSLDGIAIVKTSETYGIIDADQMFTFGNMYEVIGPANSDNLFQSGDSGATAMIKYGRDEYKLLGIAVGSFTSGSQYFVSPMPAVFQALGPNIRFKKFYLPVAMQE